MSSWVYNIIQGLPPAGSRRELIYQGSRGGRKSRQALGVMPPWQSADMPGLLHRVETVPLPAQWSLSIHFSPLSQSSSLFHFFYLFHTCIFMCVQVCVRARVCVEARGQPWVLVHLCLEKGFLSGLECLKLARHTAQQLQGPARLWLPSTSPDLSGHLALVGCFWGLCAKKASD